MKIVSSVTNTLTAQFFWDTLYRKQKQIDSINLLQVHLLIIILLRFGGFFFVIYFYFLNAKYQFTVPGFRNIILRFGKNYSKTSQNLIILNINMYHGSEEHHEG